VCFTIREYPSRRVPPGAVERGRKGGIPPFFVVSRGLSGYGTGLNAGGRSGILVRWPSCGSHGRDLTTNPRTQICQPPDPGARMEPPHRCVSCGEGLLGTWCHACGEKRRDPRDLTLRAFAG